jgi:malate/lactate dehydrogenase
LLSFSKVQGGAIDKVAKKSIRVLVVGNPANTNAAIWSDLIFKIFFCRKNYHFHSKLLLLFMQKNITLFFKPSG